MNWHIERTDSRLFSQSYGDFKMKTCSDCKNYAEQRRECPKPHKVSVCTLFKCGSFFLHAATARSYTGSRYCGPNAKLFVNAPGLAGQGGDIASGEGES